MKRTIAFARSLGTVRFEPTPGQVLEIPLFPGIFKHAAPGELAQLLSNAVAVRKYTREALRTAAWPLLKEFPREWLRSCLPYVHLRPGRRRALEFLLGLDLDTTQALRV
jgi:hypothetical protein